MRHGQVNIVFVAVGVDGSISCQILASTPWYLHYSCVLQHIWLLQPGDQVYLDCSLMFLLSTYMSYILQIYKGKT